MAAAKEDLPTGNSTLVSMAGLAASCPWVIKSLAQRQTGSIQMAGAKKDLPAKKPVKGGKDGRLAANDNVTLVRAAKPALRDLPARKPVKAGKKIL